VTPEPRPLVRDVACLGFKADDLPPACWPKKLAADVRQDCLVHGVAGDNMTGEGATPLLAGWGDSLAVMSAQPVQEHDPDDPVEILRLLPERFHEQFLSEYAAAAEAARRPEGHQALPAMLRLWRLTAAGYSEPGVEGRLATLRKALRAGSLEGSVPIEEIVPDWSSRLNQR
jgi:hypothetical protein